MTESAEDSRDAHAADATDALDDELRVGANRDVWDAWTDLHVPSDYYDVEGFLADPKMSPLDPVVLGLVGDLSGKRLLHLQCHFGMDTLRLAVMGAEVTGVDFSAKAVAAARDLADRASIRARFIESDVRSLPDSVESESFDVVFTSYGVITWLPSLEGWARTIQSHLAPGGVFHVVDMHPVLWMYDEALPSPPPVARYSYFDRGALGFEQRGSYAAPDSDEVSAMFAWQHTFEDLVSSLTGAGLTIESLREYPRIAWQHMRYLTRDEDGMWRLPADLPEMPLMFSLSARKPP